MFLQPIALYLKSKQFRQISELKKDEEEATNRRNQYKKYFIDIELVLRNNTDYYNCFLMKKIFSDIEKYNKIHISNNWDRNFWMFSKLISTDKQLIALTQVSEQIIPVERLLLDLHSGCLCGYSVSVGT